eukprot:NODE_1049_length_1740_cov_36.970432_g926_i0.p1 GENE.NODE_1049_length_1740_cov_36.970432_g926_i0~~NODE_1049_length_1740_cov_36.970432_g926_i0.p1  ORF type:complete len:540 (+),score=109.01 NODE_1049_length_1740_cov_36.970432_g926_i0:80-1621(+)
MSASVNSPLVDSNLYDDDDDGDGDDDEKVAFSWGTLWVYTGPGWLMSMAFLDPGNLESNLQSGAIGGNPLIGVLFWCTFMGYILQVVSARLGVTSGKNLAVACREAYPRYVSISLWIFAELAIIASDIQEVIGTAIAFQILFGWPLWVGCLITALDTFTFLLIHYFGMRRLELLFGAMIMAMVICFLTNFVLSSPSIGRVLLGWLLPFQMPQESVPQAVGTLGAVVMPHNLFLHSALVAARGINCRSKKAVREANYYFMLEAAVSLLISFLINAAIIATFTEGFHNDHTGCKLGEFLNGNNECVPVSLKNAHIALEGKFGRSARYLWALGLLAAGQGSTMTGTFAGQFIMEGFLDIKVAIWMRTLITRSVALVPSLIVALTPAGQGSSFDTVDELLNVLQSLILPFAIIPVLKLTGSRQWMGIFHSSTAAKVLCYLVAAVVVATNFYLVLYELWLDDGSELYINQSVKRSAIPIQAAVGIVGALYLGFTAMLLSMKPLPPIRKALGEFPLELG